MNQSGQNLSLFFYFLFVAIIFLIIFAFAIPVLQLVNTQLYASSEPVIQLAENVAGTVQDVNVRTSLVNSNESAKNSIQANNDILSNLFQYGWAIILIVIISGYVIYSRQQVERGQIV